MIPNDLLTRAAGRFGIELEYWDIWGRHHVTPPSSQTAILNSLGLDAQSPEQLASSLGAWEQRWNEHPIDPVLVLPASTHKPSVELRAAPNWGPDTTIAAAVYWENGQAQKLDYRLGDLGNEPRLPLPAPMPLGYHDLEIVIDAPGNPPARANMRLIVTPERAWLPSALEQGGRAAGVAVSLYGLRSARNWGAGDFTDLLEVIDWVAEDLGASFVALNPLHAIGNRQPYNTSPYLPATSFYRNFLYLDVEAIEDFRTGGLRLSPAAAAEIEALRQAEFVEYERVARLKLRFLKACFRQFLRECARHSERAKAFRSWAAEEGDLLDRWATWCALDETIHKQDRKLWIWPDWPEEYRKPDSDAVREFARSHPRLVTFYKYIQWQIETQLEAAQRHASGRGLAVGLYHDLALAVDKCGADLWAYRDHFVEGCRVGAPPDDFAPEGQDWAFPPPNAEAHRLAGYRPFVETIRQNSRPGGALRIDHVMRFFRLFWIPDGLTAREGTYVRAHWEDLIRILALESVRGRFLVVGEDLGTVPDFVREALADYGILSYRLFYFEKGADGLPKRTAEYPHQALVSSTTHDLPTLAGFWAGRDIDARKAVGRVSGDADYQRLRVERRAEKAKMLAALRREGLLPDSVPDAAADWDELTGEIHNAVIGYLVSTPSMLMVLNQEDLTKELDQQNLPGTTWQYPNWRRKMRFTVEELRTLKTARDFSAMFRSWLERTGRLNAGPAPQAPQS